MKIIASLSAVALLSLSTPVLAQDAASVATQTIENLRTGRLVISAEGRRLGRIDSLVGERGAPTAVRLIFNSKFVTIPVSTLSPADRPNVFQTSMSHKDLR